MSGFNSSMISYLDHHHFVRMPKKSMLFNLKLHGINAMRNQKKDFLMDRIDGGQY